MGLDCGFHTRTPASFFVGELSDDEVQLVVFQGLFDGGHGDVGQYPAEDLAFGIAGNDSDRQIGVDGFQLGIDFVPRGGRGV